MDLQLDPNAGEYLYEINRYHGLTKVIVNRLTPTQIVLDKYDTKLRRPFSDGSPAIGTSGYGNSYYYKPTEKLDEEYKRQNLLRYISKFASDTRLTSLPTDRLEKIKAIMDDISS